MIPLLCMNPQCLTRPILIENGTPKPQDALVEPNTLAGKDTIWSDPVVLALGSAVEE